MKKLTYKQVIKGKNGWSALKEKHGWEDGLIAAIMQSRYPVLCVALSAIKNGHEDLTKLTGWAPQSPSTEELLESEYPDDSTSVCVEISNFLYSRSL